MSIRVKTIARRPLTACQKRQTGFSFIEVLVATLVLSVGLLGLAGLQAASLTNLQSAFLHSQASALAYDLADRMRTNVAGVAANFYDPATAGNTAGCSTTAGCSPQQMAQNDLAEWNAAIATYLPLGQGIVCNDSTPMDGTGFGDPQCEGVGDQFSIKIWWDDDRDGIISVTPLKTERIVISFRL